MFSASTVFASDSFYQIPRHQQLSNPTTDENICWLCCRCRAKRETGSPWRGSYNFFICCNSTWLLFVGKISLWRMEIQEYAKSLGNFRRVFICGSACFTSVESASKPAVSILLHQQLTWCKQRSSSFDCGCSAISDKRYSEPVLQLV